MHPSKNSKLRQKAEAIYNKKKKNISHLSTVEIQSLFHELEVHQIELQMQNEELMQLQNELEDEKANFKSLYNDAPFGYMTINDKQQITQANSTIIEMLCGESTDILNKSITEFIPWDDKDIFYLFLVKLKEDPTKQSCQLRLYTFTGIFIYVNIEARIVDSEHIRISITDVNELITAKRKAEESDRLKSAFLANISHEIRTPMNGILGFSQLLKEPNLISETQNHYINLIETSGRRMLSIINNIVDISKIEAGQMDVHFTKVNINEQLHFSQDFFIPEIESKNLKLVLKKKLNSADALISTDGEKLYAILNNLIKNAVKYTKEGTIEYGCEVKGNFLRFYVKDTGIGIHKDKQADIFERFIQEGIENRDAGDVSEGAGLGLSISNAYVKMLGGEMRIESKQGVGSTFSFYILNNSVKETEKIIDVTYSFADLVAKTSTSKILIVEDDKISQFLLKTMLSKLKPEILIVSNGLDAIETCRTNFDIDVIFMDIQIPKLNGYLATKEIRHFNKSVTIIAQSANGLTSDKKKAINAGCNAHLTKPIVKEELYDLLFKYLDNEI